MGLVSRQFSVNTLFAILGIFATSSNPLACPPEISGAPLAPNQIDLLQLPKAIAPSLPQYQRYLDDTYQGLDLLRGSNGLIQDNADVIAHKHSIKLNVTKSDTSPTNIGIDLLVQAAMADRNGKQAKHAVQVMNQILDTLKEEPPYLDPKTLKETGLFYGWYATHGIGPTDDHNVSAVDNIHLALAFYTIQQKFHGTPAGYKAQALLTKMDFSIFYNKTTALIHGNIRDNKAEAYDYKYFGAEARSIYAVGYALGLFKQVQNEPNFLKKAVKNLDMERYPTNLGAILKAWDGGGFQVLLPEVLLNEDAYSPALHESAAAYGPFIIDEGHKLDLKIPGNETHYFPAMFSASPQGNDASGKPMYAGQAGNAPLVSPQHGKDFCNPEMNKYWSREISVHVGALASSIDAEHAQLFSPSFADMENYSFQGEKLYHKGLGFSDGVIVEKGPDYGKVVNQVSASNQLFSMAGFIRTTDRIGYGTSANAIQEDPEARDRMAYYYKLANTKLEATAPTITPIQCK